MSRLQSPQGQDSLRTRRLSTAERPPGGGAPSSSRPQPSSSQGGQQHSGGPGSRSKSSGPPPSRSAGAATAHLDPNSARKQSVVGERLLKKRQSVSYQQAVAEGYPMGDGGAIPAMPAMPSGLGAAAVGGAAPPGAGSSGAEHGSSAVAGGVSGLKLGSPPPRTDGEDQLLATGLDVDQLASETFRPEDCEFVRGRRRV